MAVAIEIKPRDKRRLTIADSTYANAAFHCALSKAEPTLGRSLHDMQRNKGFSLALILETAERATLRISFMGEEGLTYAHMLINTLAENAVLRIGPSMCDIVGIVTGHSQ